MIILRLAQQGFNPSPQAPTPCPSCQSTAQIRRGQWLRAVKDRLCSRAPV